MRRRRSDRRRCHRRRPVLRVRSSSPHAAGRCRHGEARPRGAPGPTSTHRRRGDDRAPPTITFPIARVLRSSKVSDFGDFSAEPAGYVPAPRGEDGRGNGVARLPRRRARDLVGVGVGETLRERSHVRKAFATGPTITRGGPPVSTTKIPSRAHARPGKDLLLLGDVKTSR